MESPVPTSPSSLATSSTPLSFKTPTPSLAPTLPVSTSSPAPLQYPEPPDEFVQDNITYSNREKTTKKAARLGSSHSPSVKAEIPSQHCQPQQQKTQEPHRPFRQVHSHSAPPSTPPDPVSSQPRPPPPGQIPLDPYPTPPRHDFATQVGYDAPVKRHPRSWTYRDSLSQISSSSHAILDCAETYNRIACEQHGAHAIPERLLTEWELSNMLSNMELIKRSLEHIEDLVQKSIQNERDHEGAKMKMENHAPVSVYAMQPSSGTTRTRKRLACASQTGRCHKCGRTQTPEWRRGPDGKRTLCNACGLHYAKLKRKRQIKTSSICPEPEKALQLRGSELLQDGSEPGTAIPYHFSTTVQILSKPSTIKKPS
ncbi:hypothetical protein H9L39_18135 [Fusarium oxysporum f. sp. albedinis]|nr:hypothetical protein H9L39_18135 [Fusarium oxysporum f. sp. albedinis]